MNEAPSLGETGLKLGEDRVSASNNSTDTKGESSGAKALPTMGQLQEGGFAGRGRGPAASLMDHTPSSPGKLIPRPQGSDLTFCKHFLMTSLKGFTFLPRGTGQKIWA